MENQKKTYKMCWIKKVKKKGHDKFVKVNNSFRIRMFTECKIL